MSKPPASWKSFERRVAKYIGGKRRGAYVSDGKGGKTDIIKPGFAVECKLIKQTPWSVLLDACRQAERNAESELDIPIAIVKKNGRGILDKDSLVIMRLETFRDHFIGDNNAIR